MFPFTATDAETHIFATAGTYTVTLTVSDDDGGQVEIVVVMVIL